MVIEFGFHEQQLGIFYAVLFLVSAGAVQFTPMIKRRFGTMRSIDIIGFIFVLTLIISPKLGLILGGITTLIRMSFSQILKTITSDALNQGIESKYRATSLSTFGMLTSLPYVLTAVFIGQMMDILTARVFAFYFGLALLIVLIVQKLAFDRRQS